MPPSQRRSRLGARPGSLSRELRAAMRAETARIAKLPEPLAVIKTVGATFAAMDNELERLAAVRLMAVRQLREDGWSYDRIAAATGLSKGRVQQLSNESIGRSR